MISILLNQPVLGPRGVTLMVWINLKLVYIGWIEKNPLIHLWSVKNALKKNPIDP